MYVTHAETDARQITFAPGTGACRGVRAYKTPQGVPCHEPKTSADMIGADCEKKLMQMLHVCSRVSWKYLECCGVQVAKTQLQVFVVDAGIL